MLIVALILSILAVIGTVLADKRNHEYIEAIILCFVIFFLTMVFIIALAVLRNGYDMFVIDDKIKLYEEENQNIEKEITSIVNDYQGYEKEIISNVADMETIVIKIPELKNSELVKKRMKLYVDNNKQIKKLKKRKINVSIYKWLLYFGK